MFWATAQDILSSSDCCCLSPMKGDTTPRYSHLKSDVAYVLLYTTNVYSVHYYLHHHPPLLASQIQLPGEPRGVCVFVLKQ